MQAVPVLCHFCETDLLKFRAGTGETEESVGAASRDMRPVVICGFGELGQSLVNMLESPLSQTLERGPVPYVAFDLRPARIKAARRAGFNVLYGDASRYVPSDHCNILAVMLPC